MNGILLLDKPKGITSHDCVSAVRKKLQTKRVGHAGTLDPLATGLLILAVGHATRFLQYMQLEPKCYLTTFELGVETTTYDAEGEVVRRIPADAITTAQIEQASLLFTGEIEQLPPMYSAVKLGGRPLYKLARKGEEVERAARRVNIFEFQILAHNSPLVEARLCVSSGTYIRTIVHDLGQVLGVGASVQELRRTSAGEFDVKNATTIDEVSERSLIPLTTALAPMPMLEVDEHKEAAVRNGQTVCVANVEAEKIGFVNKLGQLVSVAHRNTAGNWQPECVVPGME